MKRNIIRIGDRVRIIKPDVFVRCGYPLSIEDIRKEVGELHFEKIDQLIRDCGVSSDCAHRSNGAILKAIAYGLIHTRGFGGRERKIYTREDESLRGQECSVLGIRLVKTGMYRPGSRSGNNDWECDPPYISNEKTHKILLLDTSHTWDSVFDEIESCNVEKIEVNDAATSIPKINQATEAT